MTDISTVDWTDPCQRASALSSAYYSLLAGQGEVEIRTRTLDSEDFVRFARVDLDRLKNEMNDAVAACNRLNGVPNPARRRALPCTYRRGRGYPPGYDPTDPRG